MSTLIPLSGRRVTVMGLGRFGGGIGVVNFLLQQQALVTLTDLQPATALSTSLSQIEPERLEQLVLGEHRSQDFDDTDLVVASPAVRRDNKFLQLARARGIPVTSEMNLFWERCPAKRLVVTGSVGKSTTAALIDHVLRTAQYRVFLGGNIGVSLLGELEQMSPQDWAVLELSSYQLADLASLQPVPDIAVLTRFFPHHLDWHGSAEDYERAKQNAFRWQGANQFAVLPDDAHFDNWPGAARKVRFGTSLAAEIKIDQQNLRLRLTDGGNEIPPQLRALHQLENLAASCGALVTTGLVEMDAVVRSLNSFQTLPHRQQLVATHANRQFINDSKATTPAAAMAALRSQSMPVVLIAGGDAKHQNWSEWAGLVSKKCRSVALLGAAATSMHAELLRVPFAGPLQVSTDLDAAVNWSFVQSQPDDVILLSPGCASHDSFTNYEARGEAFVAAVNRIIQEMG